MKTNELIERFLSARTQSEMNIDCRISFDGNGNYVSRNLINQTGAVGAQMYRSIVLKYVTRQFGKYIVLNPEFRYELLNGGFNGYDIRKDYIFDTEKDTFIFGEDKKQAENEIMAKFK